MNVEYTPSFRKLTIATGLISGVLTAVSAQVLLGRDNVMLVPDWPELLGTSAVQVKFAVAWWIVAVAALCGGFISAAATRYLLLNRWPLRWLRWIAGAAVVTGLGVIGHLASAPSSLDPAASVTAGLLGMTVSVVGAAIGVFLAVRR